MRSFFGKSKGKDAGLSSSSSSSQSSPSKKGKKSSSDNKPKQPQRGLGVAQLERIRLHNQMGGSNYYPSVQSTYAPNLSQEDIRPQAAYSSPSSSFPYYSSSNPSYGNQGSHGVMMGFQDYENANIRYGESEPTNVARWQYPGNTGYGIQQYVEPSMTRSFFEPAGVEGSRINENENDRNDSEEIDLELRLSL